jgi:hypothetical protein
MKKYFTIFCMLGFFVFLFFLGCSNEQAGKSEQPSNIEKPLIIKSGGPLKTKANVVFNIQPHGNAAMWLETENASENTLVVFGNKEIKPDYHNPQKLTFTVPKECYSVPGQFEIYIYNPPNGKKSNSLTFTVE